MGFSFQVANGVSGVSKRLGWATLKTTAWNL
jgi:hypothetical protein